MVQVGFFIGWWNIPFNECTGVFLIHMENEEKKNYSIIHVRKVVNIKLYTDLYFVLLIVGFCLHGVQNPKNIQFILIEN